MSAPAGGRLHFDYTKGSIGRGTARITIPTLFQELAWISDGIAEIYWLGWLGTGHIAAMSLGFMTIAALRAIGLGIRIAGQALVAQRIGTGDPEGASLVAAQALTLSFFYVLPVAFLGYWLAPGVMALLTADAEIARLGTAYLRAGFIAYLFIEGLFALEHILRGAGDPGVALAGMGGATAVTLAAMPILIFGAGPVPAFGIAGAFLGNGVGRVVGILIIIHFLRTGRSRLRFRAAYFLPRAAHLGRIARLAWPASLQNFLERAANLALVGLLSPFGPLYLAAWGIGTRVSIMGRMPGFVLGLGTRTLVGQNLGARRPGRARRGVWVALGAMSVSSLAVTAFLLLWAEAVVRFFGMGGEATAVGALCIRILAAGLFFDAGRRLIAGAFEGASAMKPPMIVEAVIRWGILIPGAYLAAVPLGFAAPGVWWVFTGSQVVGFILIFIWYLMGIREEGAPLFRGMAAGGGAPPTGI